MVFDKKEYRKQWKIKNKERLLSGIKKWKQTHPEKVKEYVRKCRARRIEQDKISKKNYYQKHKEKWEKIYQENRERILETRKLKRRENKKLIKLKKRESDKKLMNVIPQWKWLLENNIDIPEGYEVVRKKYNYREYNKKYQKTRRTNDMQFLIGGRLRSLLYGYMNRYTLTGKIQSTKMYGIDWNPIVEKLMNILPNDFLENPSKYHIDHIKPCCSFDLTNPEQVKKCFSPENLQWLTAEENIRKGGRLEEEVCMSI